ncbi:MAG: DUF3108 domain-containing protein [Cyclobacteriaceae bacterium]|nr:DUF3108 domain-containing protein [Cyclobacteriaceae bacterium]
MKYLLNGFLAFILLTSFSSERRKDFIEIKNTSFGTGEVLEYRVNFGFFTVGKASTVVEKAIYTKNSRPCYKVDAYGETLGFVSWISKVNDQWGAYVDTAALVTHVSYRKIKEGNYRKDEVITYNHDKLEAEVKVKNKETGVYEAPKYYKTPDNVRDMVAGFLYLRAIDFNKKYKKGDTLAISGFFEDTPYNMKIIYDGKETIKTKVGKIHCHRLVPIMPDNKIFDGENSITCWMSDDGNRVPVKIQAKMFIGSTGIELTNFRGLRNQFRVLQ